MKGNRAGSRNSTGGEPGDQPRRDLPGLVLAGQLTRTAGPGRRYAGRDDDTVVLAAGRWDAVESWAYAQKLAAARELVRRRPAAGAAVRLPGGTPTVWRKDLAAEIACELAVTTHAAETLASLAVVLETRLPLTAAALDAGILNASKARLIAEETAVLSDELAGQAEAEIADRWAGQTWARIRDLITRAVVNADPEAAIRRREQAEREDARIRFFREQAGTCGLAGYSLPADEALKANQALCARARAYRNWGIDGTMEQLRVMAYLDLLTSRDARDRYPRTTPARGRKAKPGTPHGDGQPRDRGTASTAGTGHGTDTAGHGADTAGAGRDSATVTRRPTAGGTRTTGPACSATSPPTTSPPATPGTRTPATRPDEMRTDRTRPRRTRAGWTRTPGTACSTTRTPVTRTDGTARPAKTARARTATGGIATPGMAARTGTGRGTAGAAAGRRARPSRPGARAMTGWRRTWT